MLFCPSCGRIVAHRRRQMARDLAKLWIHVIDHHSDNCPSFSAACWILSGGLVQPRQRIICGKSPSV